MRILPITLYTVAVIIMTSTMFRTGHDIGMNIPATIVITNTFITGLFQSSFIFGLGKLLEGRQ